MDKSIPWEDLNKTIEVIGIDYESYSKEARVFISPIRNTLRNALQKYFQASQFVFEWTSHASSVLSVYLQAINTKGTKGMVIDVLDDGVVKLSQSVRKLNIVDGEFKKAYIELLSLSDQLKIDFSSESNYYRNNIAQTRLTDYAGGTAIGMFAVLSASIVGFILG